jgi:integrase
MGLGPYPDVSLRTARLAAADSRTAISKRLDPIRERRRATEDAAIAAGRERTFEAAAEAMLTAREPGWRNAKHRAQWRATLKQYAYPALGSLPVAEVGVGDVLRVLRTIWTRTPETASRIRGRIEAILAYSSAHGWRTGDNPARWRGLLAELLPAPRKVVAMEHRPALPWQQMPLFMRALSDHRGVAAKALRFAILTAARTGEVRGTTWGEVDLGAAVWTIPPIRMKAGRIHRVPLSAPALKMLMESRPHNPVRDALIFAAPRSNGPLSDMSLSMLVRGMCFDGLPEGSQPRWGDHLGRAVVPHGFRSTFRDWAGETRPEGREVVERALAHTIRDKAEAAYARSDLLEKRRTLMEAWGVWLTGPIPGTEGS